MHILIYEQIGISGHINNLASQNYGTDYISMTKICGRKTGSSRNFVPKLSKVASCIPIKIPLLQIFLCIEISQIHIIT